MPTLKRRRYRPVEDRLHFASPYRQGYRQWLTNQGYTDKTIAENERLLVVWTQWVHEQGYGFDTIHAAYDASKPVFEAQRKCLRRSMAAARSFLRYLTESGIIEQPTKPPAATETWPILGEFRMWMRTHRGVASSTLNTYQTTLVPLVKTLGDDTALYDAVGVRTFVMEYAQRHGRGRAKCICVATRAFLRFLAATGKCGPELAYAVPAFASWRHASLPNHLSMTELECLIASCDPIKRGRDRAIILLLARLGLRASEVANLQFADFDWRNSRFAVSGKSRRTDQLPLTQEIGDAILHYIEDQRPQWSSPYVFLTHTSPIRPITRITVKSLVKSALDRAGIESCHRGAHLLRHSAASAMLQNGVTLAGVGAVLRHRSPGVTGIYAKIDSGLLSQVAKPWVGRLPC